MNKNRNLGLLVAMLFAGILSACSQSPASKSYTAVKPVEKMAACLSGNCVTGTGVMAIKPKDRDAFQFMGKFADSVPSSGFIYKTDGAVFKVEAGKALPVEANWKTGQGMTHIPAPQKKALVRSPKVVEPIKDMSK